MLAERFFYVSLNIGQLNQYNRRLFLRFVTVVTMRLLRGLHNPGIEKTGCVATIGNFDGVHVGHQAIIQQVVAKAKVSGVPSVAIIFEPQPMEYFNRKHAPARLMRFREKFQALSAFELDYVFCLKFDASLSRLSAKAFIDKVLVSHLNIRHLVIGDDFRFGGDRTGDFSLLVETGRGKGFTVERTPTLIDEQIEKGVRVSSTHVRNLLFAGRFADAEQLLARPYQITGRVVHGKKLGRQIGFPTANIALHRVKVPFSGVYVVKLIRNNGKRVDGIANIGIKPTVGNFLPSLEVHLLDFEADIYGEQVGVQFRKKVREERRFDSIEALKQQIAKDIDVARRWLKKSQMNG